MKKKIPVWFARFLLSLILIPFILGAIVFFSTRSNAPSVQDAPWAIQTYIYTNSGAAPTHVYYGKAFSSVNGQPALFGYWEFDGRKYNYINGVKVFDKKSWGKIDIIRRAG